MNINRGKKFLSDLKLHSDYFKWIESEERYETWEDAQKDIIHGHRNKYKHVEGIEEFLNKAENAMIDQLVLASQRTLQYRHKQLMAHNVRLYNCCGSLFNSNEYFQQYFYILLCGTGLDFSVRKRFINQLSKIQKRENDTITYVVEDSIEGWANALGVLLSSYFVDNQPFPQFANCKVRMDYSQIREKGSYISGGFKAPGPEGLKQSLEKIEKLLDDWIEKEGNIIRPILAYDIVMHSADAVLSGGVRRSACSIIIDEDDEETINAKIGNWRETNPQRARSNNAIGLLRSELTKEKLEKIIGMNQGDNDISFILVNDEWEVSNPCREITFRPVLENGEIAIQFCNLCEINAEKCTTEKIFLQACEAASILGTLQAGYTSFPYLGKNVEQLVAREALLGVSITGWMNNPKLFDADLLKKGANLIKTVNENFASLLGINPAARTTCVKPSGNASVILGTASGIHPEHSQKYFRVMQLNKEASTAKWLEENMPFILEESVWSATNADYVVFIPIENPKGGLYKADMKGIKHLELIKLVQENWVDEGTNEKYCLKPWLRHSTSCTVIIDNIQEITDYIFEHNDKFKAVSFLSDYGDKDFNQAPFTSILNTEDIMELYGKGALLASGLIVDGLHYFNGNLWEACDSVLNKNYPIAGTRDQVLLKKYWLERAKKFAKNYFKNDLKQMIYCLKDVHLFHKWETISRNFKNVDFSKILTKPEYKDVSDYAAMACSGTGSCEIIRM